MSKKKMCPYKDTWDCTATPHMCPKNTNDRCEIIPKKPKMVRIKAYAYIGATTKTICVSTTEPFCKSVPCVAVIKAKDAKALTEMMEGE